MPSVCDWTLLIEPCLVSVTGLTDILLVLRDLSPWWGYNKLSNSLLVHYLSELTFWSCYFIVFAYLIVVFQFLILVLLRYLLTWVFDFIPDIV